jgi:nucleotide-binding universal stress UspA family protein
MKRIVVGVDSSDDSVRALRWAIDEARLRGAELEIVHAFPTPELVAIPAVVTLPSDDELRKGAEEVIDGALSRVGGADDVPVTRTMRAGSSASVLCDVAVGADLLVVGARGLGGFRGLLLGSVTHQVVAHSPCPVVVSVPEDR